MRDHVTISVPKEIAAKAQRAVDAGKAESVSAYFVKLAEREPYFAEQAVHEPDWAAAREVLDEIAAETEVTEQDRAWARTALGLDWAASEALVNRVLEEVGGVSGEDREWVDSVLGPDDPGATNAV